MYSDLVDYICWSPNHSGERDYDVTRITPHYVAGNCSVETIGDIFADPARRASSNYGIGSDGRVGCYVDEDNRAWTSGSYDNDNRAITIECANLADASLTDACWRSLVALCADICRRYGIEDCTYTGDTDGVLTMHQWFQDTDCPGPWLEQQFERLSREVNAALHPAPPKPRHIVPDFGLGAVYRLFDGQRHMYTSSREEAQALSDDGWTDEGLGWRAPERGDKVRRLYNPWTGQHLLTVDDAEAITLIDRGWHYEGVPLLSGGGVEVYRLLNDNSGDHVFTTSTNERDGLARIGWVNEGVGLHGV